MISELLRVQIDNFEEFLASSGIGWDLDQYSKQNNRKEFILTELRGAIDRLDEVNFEGMQIAFNLYKNFRISINDSCAADLSGNSDAHSQFELSLIEFKKSINWSRFTNYCFLYLENEVYKATKNKMESENITKEYQKEKELYIIEQKKKLNFFMPDLPCALSDLQNITNSSEVKKKYKDILILIKANFSGAYLSYNDFDFDKVQIKFDQYIEQLRMIVIETLKKIEELTPYKEIIKSLVELVPGYKTSYGSKHFIDEWDVYFKSRSSIHIPTNLLLNKKYIKGANVSASEYLFLFEKKSLTSFGYDHLYDVLDRMTIVIAEREKEINTSLIDKYSKKYDSLQSRFLAKEFAKPEQFKKSTYWFYYRMSLFEREINEITRISENIVREEFNLPKVNQGWLSETKLYNEIVDWLPKLKIIHHARLSFLGKQHLDIFIPALKIGIEYQGIQHDKPVEYFGGIEAFYKNQERDLRKYDLCKSNSVRIVYVREGYNIEDVMKEIKNA